MLYKIQLHATETSGCVCLSHGIYNQFVYAQPFARIHIFFKVNTKRIQFVRYVDDKSYMVALPPFGNSQVPHASKLLFNAVCIHKGAGRLELHT